MKKIFVNAGLVLALIGVSHIWAQEQAEEVVKKTTVSIEQPAVEDDISDKGLKLDVEVGVDEKIDQESIDRVGKILREVAGDDVANEVVLELEGLSAQEKKEFAKALKCRSSDLI